MDNNKKQCEIGMVGLGIMGQNLLLNMADHGFSVAGYYRDRDKVKDFHEESQGRNIQLAGDYATFTGLLRRPRAVMLLVPAGAAVDEVIKDLLPYLEQGDLIIDAGNSYFKDTDIRAHNLNAKGIHYLGMGVSGGEEGARRGPSIMPGGSKEDYQRISPVLEAVAAKVNGDPCVSYLGPGSVGHFVKMVHNGIEYAIMQLIAESYDLMKRGLDLNNDQLRDIYTEWNKGELNSYLIEITGKIFDKEDEKNHKRLIDEISSVAKQNNTGMWTSQSGMELQVPITTIDVAVSMRDMSVLVKEREQANLIYQRPIRHISAKRDVFLKQLHDALYCGIIIAYAQGMALLRAASDHYQYNLNLETVARIWRGGCIIRAKLLEDISTAFHAKNDLQNLLLDPNLARQLMAHQENLRQIVCMASESGISAPGLMASLSYLDAYRSAWSPANLIQAQRDYFGAHTYERIDVKGIFHTEWEKI